MNEFLKPCPFCGSYNRRMCQTPTYYKPNPHVWYVKCWDCEAQGSRHFTEDEAFNAWNTRSDYETQRENELRIEQREAARTLGVKVVHDES